MLVTLMHCYKHAKFQSPTQSITLNDSRLRMSCFQCFEKIQPSPPNIQFQVYLSKYPIENHKLCRIFIRLAQYCGIRDILWLLIAIAIFWHQKLILCSGCTPPLIFPLCSLWHFHLSQILSTLVGHCHHSNFLVPCWGNILRRKSYRQDQWIKILH